MSLITWGDGGDYATLPTAVDAIPSKGNFLEDHELQQVGDSIETVEANFTVDFSFIGSASNYKLDITNPNGYKCVWGIQDGFSIVPVWDSVSSATQFKILNFDGLDIVQKDSRSLIKYGATLQATIQNCKIQSTSNFPNSYRSMLQEDLDFDGVEHYIRVKNSLLIDSGGTQNPSGFLTALTPPQDPNGKRQFENLTLVGFATVTTRANMNGEFSNCFFDIADTTIENMTFTTCASSSSGTDIPANLRDLDLSDMFEKYLIADIDDPDYFQSKVDTVLSTEATYPPVMPEHIQYYDETVITSDNPIIGMKYTKPVVPIVITVQPQSQVLSIGDKLLLSYEATGGSYLPFTQIWRKNGNIIDQATLNPYVVQSIGIVDFGNYTVEVSDGVTSTLSEIAIISDGTGLVHVLGVPDAITFLVEFPSGESSTFGSTSVSVHTNPAGAIIHAISVAPYPTEDSYWLDWGGVYDNPLDSFLVLFIEKFLIRVDTIEQLLLYEFSSVVVGDTIYFRTPFYPWQYNELLRRIEYLYGFSTNVPDPRFPSNDRFGGIRYPVKLRPPSLPINLSNPVNGIFLTPSFTIELENGDGFFDKQNSKELINTPIVIRKSSTIPATIETFVKIREGEIEDVPLNEMTFSLTGADILRTLEQPVTRTLEEAGFIGGGTNMPIAYGTIRKASLIASGEGEFVVCDPDYLTSVTTVYDNDGIEIEFTELANGKISCDPSADKVDFLGLPNNNIGEIIVNEIGLKANILYDAFFWNTGEANIYIENSYSVDFLFQDGTVKNLVSELLVNDMAFLIQQNDGRLTLRKWGETYKRYSMAAWLITQKPSRKLSSYKFYSSSVIMKYFISEGKAQSSYLDTSVEVETIAQWKKKTRLTHETLHEEEGTIWDFSSRLLERFANRAELWAVPTGVDTSVVEMLDSLELEIITGKDEKKRTLSSVEDWIIAGIDPAQDVFQLEEDTTIAEEVEQDIPISDPGSEFEDGYLAEPSSSTDDGYLSQTDI